MRLINIVEIDLSHVIYCFIAYKLDKIDD